MGPGEGAGAAAASPTASAAEALRAAAAAAASAALARAAFQLALASASAAWRMLIACREFFWCQRTRSEKGEKEILVSRGSHQRAESFGKVALAREGSEYIFFCPSSALSHSLSLAFFPQFLNQQSDSVHEIAIRARRSRGLFCDGRKKSAEEGEVRRVCNLAELEKKASSRFPMEKESLSASVALKLSELSPETIAFQLLQPRESLALTSVSLVVRERRRSTKDEDEHNECSLVVVVVGRGRSRDAGLPPLGDSAPVNRRGLISMLPSKEHGGGTARRGSEWVPRGEPEESGALFFITFFFLRKSSSAEARRKRKRRPAL